jgi:ribonuclease HII
MLVCGIDEAGKGPVIGDLVIAGCLIKENTDISNMGIKDSKLLKREKREELFGQIKNVVKGFDIVRVPAMEIDMKNKVGCNLNTLECMKMAQIINKLNPDKVIIDCPHPNPNKFEREIRTYLKNPNIIIVAEHKADYNYPLVGAASILAKVTRDNHIKELEEKLGIVIGSGYCTDPITKKSLNDNFENPGLKEYIRHSWSTYDKLKAQKEQKGLFDC